MLNTYQEFPISVIERLGYYVYTLADPEGKIFYVGKGAGNRIFAHLNEAIEHPRESDKLNKIREIHAAGCEIKYEIIRHGLTENEAFEVEAAIIDFIGLNELTNVVAGHNMERRGRMTIHEIIASYEAKPVVITEPVILIIVNKLFERNITPDRLYEITRGNWVVGERRNKAKYACCVYRSVIREVYKINDWFPVQARFPHTKRQYRWRFNGEVSNELQHYVGGSVGAYLRPRAQNPVLYVNC
jgi:uncharacterized protein